MSDINRQFRVDLDEFARQTGLAAGLLAKHVALRIFTGVVRRTPVDTGIAKASWDVGIGADPGPSIATIESVASGDVLSKAAKISAAGPYTAIYISNYVPYIVYLEEGRSSQAPSGMVEVTVNEAKSELRSLTR